MTFLGLRSEFECEIEGSPATSGDGLSYYRCELGEGLYVHQAFVAWLDIAADHLYLSDRQRVARFNLPVKATVILDYVDCALILASAEGLGMFSLSMGTYRPLNAERKSFCDSTVRTNDGCRLSNGSILLGTMHKVSPGDIPGAVLLVDDGVIHQVMEEISIPNLFVELPSGQVLIADSHQETIFRCKLDAKKNKPLKVSEWYKAESGVSPDGGCLLPDGRVAVAMWNAACIRIFDTDGALSCELPVLAKRPTNVKYDQRNHELLVTSAYQGLEDESLESYPMSGMTFSIPYPKARN